jgi:hypothetical protein
VGPLTSATARATDDNFLRLLLFCITVNGGCGSATTTETDHDSGDGVYGAE